MNREIKFRAWDKKDKKMLNWDYIEDICGVGYILYNERITPMQYTGLKDKNGKEIYEFDILQNNAGAKRVVEQTKYGEYKLFCGEHSDSFYKGWMPNTEWEVIGNIYENPDLINK